MSIPTPRLRTMSLMGLALVGSWLTPAPTRAGLHKHRQQSYVPVYAQQAQAPTYYTAQAPVTYAAQAPVTYAAQAPMMTSAPTYYAAPAAAPVYSAFATGTNAAPVQVQAQAPAQTQLFVSNAPGAVGGAPGANVGSRIRAVDRADIIEELRNEYRGTDSGGTRRERRSTLRDSARTMFSEAIGEDPENLNESELQEIENIVSSIIDSTMSQTGKAPITSGEAPYGYVAPAVSYTPVTTTTTYVPVMQAPLIQPVVPVQLWVPVQPKHKLFRHK